MSAGYKGKVAMAAGAFYAPDPPHFPPDTWQRYLSRLGNGINGVSERSKDLTEADIVANAHKWMQKKYPGPYTVEQFYNTDKMKWDLRLVFVSPADETWFRLKYS